MSLRAGACSVHATVGEEEPLCLQVLFLHFWKHIHLHQLLMFLREERKKRKARNISREYVGCHSKKKLVGLQGKMGMRVLKSHSVPAAASLGGVWRASVKARSSRNTPAPSLTDHCSDLDGRPCSFSSDPTTSSVVFSTSSTPQWFVKLGHYFLSGQMASGYNLIQQRGVHLSTGELKSHHFSPFGRALLRARLFQQSLLHVWAFS